MILKNQLQSLRFADKLPSPPDLSDIKAKIYNNLNDNLLAATLDYFYLHSFTAAKIADIMQCSERAVYNRKNKALKKLEMMQ